MDDVSYLAGILLGSLIVILVGLVYYRTQKTSPATLGLALIAVALIGLPVWAKVSLQLGQFKADFERRLDSVEQVTTTLAEEVPKIATVTELNRQFAEQAVHAIQTEQAPSPAELQMFKERLQRMPTIRVDSLNAISRRVQRGPHNQ